MSRRLILSDQAEVDLEEIADYIAKDSPRAALRVVTALRAKCAIIAEQPELYPVLESITPEFRRALARPYGIWFQIAPDDTVRIERIVHGARDLPSLFEPKP
ncbi:MAG: type II toxin-antitoxin system RelE/ParE family toxin [Terricaulis sp.]